MKHVKDVVIDKSTETVNVILADGREWVYTQLMFMRALGEYNKNNVSKMEALAIKADITQKRQYTRDNKQETKNV